jgi:hypothetical protein
LHDGGIWSHCSSLIAKKLFFQYKVSFFRTWKDRTIGDKEKPLHPPANFIFLNKMIPILFNKELLLHSGSFNGLKA